VLRMLIVDRKRSSGNDWIVVILGVSPMMELESILLATSSNRSATGTCHAHLCHT
jgi:allantoicase